jgi:hypothetical protein
VSIRMQNCEMKPTPSIGALVFSMFINFCKEIQTTDACGQ